MHHVSCIVCHVSCVTSSCVMPIPMRACVYVRVPRRTRRHPGNAGQSYQINPKPNARTRACVCASCDAHASRPRAHATRTRARTHAHTRTHTHAHAHVTQTTPKSVKPPLAPLQNMPLLPPSVHTWRRKSCLGRTTPNHPPKRLESNTAPRRKTPPRQLAGGCVVGGAIR